MPAGRLEVEARAFAETYAALFASPAASSVDGVAQIARDVSKCYRAGVTFFTNGDISRFESQQESADLIEREMRKNIESGLGTCLLIQSIETSAYSNSAVTCHLKWTFQPQAGSEYEGRTWTFVNIYGYRAADERGAAGWEYVVRDNEVLEMKKVVGKAFNE